MKILLVNHFFSPVGGAEVIFYNTYKLLKENNHDVYIWATDYKPYIETDYKYEQYFTKYNGENKNFIKNYLSYFYNYQAKNDLEKIIEEIKPDIIHIHSFDILTTSILESCKEIPIVYTVHGANLFCPAGTLMLKNNKICKKQLCKNNNYFPCVLNKCAQNKLGISVRRSLLYLINNKNLKKVDKYICPSKILKSALIKAEVGVDKNNIYVVNNFLRKEEFDIPPIYSKGKYFLYVGRLSKEKNIILLLNAFKNLPREIQLRIVGTGKEEEVLKKFAKDNNLSNVKFLGQMKHEEVKVEYQSSISTILPCNWFEIFGMTNIESFINGKPVIASNIGGIPEIVEDNINGLLFEPANVEQLKECILKYWNNPELAIEHGKNGYQKAITQYTEDRYYNELIKIYEEVLDEYKSK